MHITVSTRSHLTSPQCVITLSQTFKASNTKDSISERTIALKMPSCGAQPAQNCPQHPSAPANRHDDEIPVRKLFQEECLQIPAASRLKNPRCIRAFAVPLTLELRNSKSLQTFVSAFTAVNPISFKLLLTGQLISRLHPNAVLSGNLTQIAGIPLETCRSIQHLVQRGKLDCARHLRVNIDLGRPPKRKYFGISGVISFKIH